MGSSVKSAPCPGNENPEEQAYYSAISENKYKTYSKAKCDTTRENLLQYLIIINSITFACRMYDKILPYCDTCLQKTQRKWNHLVCFHIK